MDRSPVLGRCPEESTMAPTISIHVKTGNLEMFSGTNDSVTVTLVDHHGRRSDELSLDKWFRNDLEKGTTEVYEFHKVELGPIARIEVKKSGTDDWFCEHIHVKNHITGTEHPFPMCRWVNTKKAVHTQEHSCCLPEDDIEPAIRKSDLDHKRTEYELDLKLEDCLPQVKTVPSAETLFSLDYASELVAVMAGTQIDSILAQIKAKDWTSLADLKPFYEGIETTFAMPKAAEADWQSDRYFGYQRVAGTNPVMIKLCSALPKNFPVTSKMVEPFLDNMTLQEAISKKRIFIVDLTVLEKVDQDHPDKYKMCAPMALFYLNNKQDLMPIAIQLFPHPGPTNPIFLPSDPKNKWLMVKMWFNNAEAQVHESVIHLGLTHLLVETISVSANRQLSHSHPVLRLMAPHFKYLYQLNASAFHSLLGKGAIFDRLISIGPQGAGKLICAYYKDWRMDAQGGILSDLKARGVDSPDVLPCYPYRDDAVLLHDAIKKFVTEALTFYYDTPGRLARDAELQAWAKELALSVKKGGCGIQGLPGGGHFDNLDDVITIVTNVIATCSVGHAAVNFNQYDQYGFPAAYPIMLHGNPPQDKEEMTEKDILKHLPGQFETTQIMSIVRLLSEKATTSLGDYDIQYLSHQEQVDALGRFRANLEAAGYQMKSAGTKRPYPYDILWPEHIPNAISI